jgi:hypothetical protein
LFDPNSDKNAVHAILRSDSTILSLLSISTDMEIAEHILKRSKWDDLASSNRRLNIFFAPSRSSRNQLIIQPVLQIECHVPAKLDYIAEDVIKRCKELLHKTKINNRYLYFSGQMGESPTMPGFYCTGARFVYYTTI